MNISASPLFNDSARTSGAFLNKTSGRHPFASLFREESVALDKNPNEDAIELKRHLNSVKQFMQIGIEENLALLNLEGLANEESNNLVEDSQQDLHVSQSDRMLGHEEHLSSEDHISALVKLINDMELLLTNGDLIGEEFVQLSQLLKDFLSNVPEEVTLTNEQIAEITSLVYILEQKISLQQSHENHEPLIVHLLTGNSFHELELDESPRFMQITRDLETISNQARQIIDQALTEEQTVKMTKQLTELLEKAHQYKQDSSISMADEVINSKKSEVDKIWSNLQSMYDKRAAMNKTGVYVDTAKVRSTDVSSWLEHMVGDTNVSQTQSVVHLQQQMTPVEQYVMHVRPQGGIELQNEELMQQLKQIINQSTVGKNQFFKQLSITIQPEQLGEITIRLVQIEGELIAKITVTSQAAKNALDSNLHQLKNMFAPHQVLIEKQDGEDQTNFDKNDAKEDQEHSSSESEEEHHAEDSDDRSFQDQFEQILEETVGE